MKLIIDIPEVTVQEIRFHGLFLCPRDSKALEKAIREAVPLICCSECKFYKDHWCSTNDGDMTLIDHADAFCWQAKRRNE